MAEKTGLIPVCRESLFEAHKQRIKEIGLQDDEITRNFDITIWTREGKSDRNKGGVALVFRRQDWPTLTRRRLGLKKSIMSLKSTPEAEAFYNTSWRATSLHYDGSKPATSIPGLKNDLANLGYSQEIIADVVARVQPYF